MITAHGTLVLVLDSGKMLLFRNVGTATTPHLQALAHLEANNPRSAVLGTDRPGRNHARFAGNRSALAETDLHDEQEDRFISHAIAKLAEIQGARANRNNTHRRKVCSRASTQAAFARLASQCRRRNSQRSGPSYNERYRESYRCV